MFDNVVQQVMIMERRRLHTGEGGRSKDHDYNPPTQALSILLLYNRNLDMTYRVWRTIPTVGSFMSINTIDAVSRCMLCKRRWLLAKSAVGASNHRSRQIVRKSHQAGRAYLILAQCLFALYLS